MTYFLVINVNGCREGESVLLFGCVRLLGVERKFSVSFPRRAKQKEVILLIISKNVVFPIYVFR